MDVSLVLFKKDGSQKTFTLPSSVTIIGRRHDCDLCVPLASVSRRHCQLNSNKDTLKIRDLGSRNGTYLNGKRINDEMTIQPGDYLTIGSLTFLFQINGQPKEIAPPEIPKAEAKKPPTKEKSKSSGDLAGKPLTKPAGEDEDIFAELELEEPNESESDSFLAELEDI